MTEAVGGEAGVRHPLDPDPVRSTKSTAVLVLGVVAVLTGPLVGGLVPATIAIVLANQARRELVEAAGFLTGARHIRLGVNLAWVAVTLAVAALVAAAVIGIMSLAEVAQPDFPDSSD